MTTQITLPRDAEGREIPLDTSVLYDKDSNELCVKRFEFAPFVKEWCVIVQKSLTAMASTYYRNPQNVYLEKPAPPDTWEKLLEDLDRCAIENDGLNSIACAYMNQGGGICGDCKFCDNRTRRCLNQMVEDIASRIRRLGGKDE